MAKIPRFQDIIIHEDEQLLVVNKPAHLSSLDERNTEAPSLLAMARKYHAEAQLCHRLDKETSGVLLIAKDNETYKAIAQMLENRKVEKIYHAVVEGKAIFDQYEIKLPLAANKKGIAEIDYYKGKEANTIVSTLKNYMHFSLLECKPVSGRLHQIRVHLAAQNFSIAADTLYGGHAPMLSALKRKFKTSKWSNEEPMMKRVALHASRVHFHWQEKDYSFEAPYPKDFEVFLKLLEKYDSA